MAYLDDNNDNLYTAGDPLDELDKELAQLRASLGEMSEDAPAQPDDAEDPVDEPVDEPLTALPESLPAKTTPQPMRRAAPKKSRAPLTAVIIVLVLLLLGGVGFGVYRAFLQPKPDPDAAPTAGGEVVTISDPDMGDIEIQTVEGAELNYYTKDNLTTDENGFYAYYEDGKKISHLGADLSEFQTDVDFAALKEAGVEFVMLRVGGRYYGTEGGLYEDTSFESFYEQASAEGLKVGAYFLSQATDAEEAKEEAAYVLKILNGRRLDYPIAFDWENIKEDEARTDNVTSDTLTLMAQAFCDAVTDGGYRSLIYANTEQMLLRYDYADLKDCDFWLADYRDFPYMYYKFDMWQYTKSGTIDGIEGSVDLNISFTDFSAG